MYPLYRRYAAIAFVCVLSAVSGRGALNVLFGGRQVAFWTEAPPRQTPPVQTPNFADIAERLKPAVVNINTTQMMERPRHRQRGTLPGRPFGDLARSCGLERPQGAFVAHVDPDSAGTRAGIQEGDVILEFNDRMIVDKHELLRLIASTPPGSEIRRGEDTLYVALLTAE